MAPSDDPLQGLTAKAQAISARIHELERELCDRKSEYADTLDKIAKIKRQKLRTPTLLASLPVEIFLDIFEYFCEIDPEGPVTLSLVCRSWQQAAVKIGIGHPRFSSKSDQKSLANGQFERGINVIQLFFPE